jgi:uncharacterized protein
LCTTEARARTHRLRAPTCVKPSLYDLMIPRGKTVGFRRDDRGTTMTPATARLEAPSAVAPVTSLIVIQPTPFCNINCLYCYLPQRSDRTRLRLDQLRTVFDRVLRFPTLSDRVTVVWHAGEPLVLGVDYYSAAFACVRDVCPTGLTVEHAFQTNGMLITQAWCQLIRQWNVGVGISIDGPQRIHDAARKTRSGRGTFSRAIAGLVTLQRNEVPFYVISVLTKAALLDPVAMFDFYQTHAITDVGFNIEEEEGIHERSSLGTVDKSMFAGFLQRFSEMMEERQFPIAVREFEETLAAIHGLDSGAPASNQLVPFGIISIDVRGNLYTFSPELVGYSNGDFPTFAIGNIFDDSFDRLCASTVLQKMTERIDKGVEMCRAECKYFPVCGGGAPSNKVFENGTFASTETMYCRLSKKAVTDFVLATIEARYAL